MRKRLAGLMMAAAIAGTTGAAQAAPVVDQSLLGVPLLEAALASTPAFAQAFTVVSRAS